MEANIGWSLLILFFGILIMLVGIIGYQYYRSMSAPEPSWTFILMIGGAIVIILMLILITIFYIRDRKYA